VAVITVALIAFAALAASPDASQIAPGIYLIPGVFSPGSQPDGNTVILRAPDGFIVVDTGRHPEHTQQIADFASREKRPVAAVVNTHWHLDHVGGNALLRDWFPSVRVYASDAIREARTGFLASYRKQLEEMLGTTSDPVRRRAFEAELGLIDQGARLEPDEVVARPGTRTVAGLPLEFGLETRAVTGGDVWLFDPKTKVLVAGDLVTLPAPLLDTACPARWKDSLDRLSRVGFTQLVPGHGRTMTRADFETYRAGFTHLLACGGGDRSKEECISGWLHDVSTLVPEKDQAFTRSLMDYYVGVLRSDPAKIAKLCGS
jgi:glyoxylase-like metal-dependent hydrolase (beta-lactamase superfamily II)